MDKLYRTKVRPVDDIHLALSLGATRYPNTELKSRQGVLDSVPMLTEE